MISGNTEDGINLSLGSNGTIVQGNYIGTDATGSFGLGNGDSGIVDSTTDNLFGGLTTGAGNVISGNGDIGLQFFGGNGNSVVQGNLIGVDATGSHGLPNSGDGIFIQGSNNDTIGGSTAGAGNVISANGGNRWHRNARLVRPGRDHSRRTKSVPDATGTLALGNLGHGIDLFSSNNTVGGPTAGQGNIIANTRGHSKDRGRRVGHLGQQQQLHRRQLDLWQRRLGNRPGRRRRDPKHGGRAALRGARTTSRITRS